MHLIKTGSNFPRIGAKTSLQICGLSANANQNSQASKAVSSLFVSSVRKSINSAIFGSCGAIFSIKLSNKRVSARQSCF